MPFLVGFGFGFASGEEELGGLVKTEAQNTPSRHLPLLTLQERWRLKGASQRWERSHDGLILTQNQSKEPSQFYSEKKEISFLSEQ